MLLISWCSFKLWWKFYLDLLRSKFWFMWDWSIAGANYEVNSAFYNFFTLLPSKWNDHIIIITVKAVKCLYLLRQLKRAGISTRDLITFYCRIIRSVLEHSNRASCSIEVFLITCQTILSVFKGTPCALSIQSWIIVARLKSRVFPPYRSES
jgi:hypothetical protein